MKNTKTIAVMAALGSGAYFGYKYMKCHPEVRRNMKNMAKSATKRMYEMLDEMD